MLELQRVGIKYDLKLKKSFLMSKYFTLYSFDFPLCKKVRIILPFFESQGTLQTKRVLIFLKFLDSFTGIRPIISKMVLVVGKGLWIRSEVNLSGFSFNKFWVFFNEVFLSHPLLRYSLKRPKFV